MNAGDVCWVDLPSADGREQAGRRPAVVLQDDRFAAASPLLIVVPLTTVPAATRFPGSVKVPRTVTNGLREDSIALVFQIRAIDRRRVRDRIGAVDADLLSQLFAALDGLLGRVPPLSPS